MRNIGRIVCAALLATGIARAEESAPQVHPNSGFANEQFFLRSSDDNFILLPSGRLQFDYLQFQGGGAKAPSDGFLPKRARIEVGGTILQRFDFWLGSDFTNAAPNITDVWINGNFHRWLQVQVGQFDAPFTMDNRTSDKYSDLQERSIVSRALGIPENKEIGAMLWGQPERKWAYWSAGVFNGDGLQVFPHRSNGFDAMGRGWIAPFGLAGNELLKNVWVGASGWRGEHAATPANQVDRLAMKTQGGLAFFTPAANGIHAGTSGTVSKWGLELNAPIGQFVLKSEFVHSAEGLREVDATQKNTPVGNAALTGNGFYVRLSYFVWGDPLINGLGGSQNPMHLYEGPLREGKTQTALQLVGEYDHVAYTYAPVGDHTGNEAFAGDGTVHVFAIGLNYWATKHVRLTVNVLRNQFEGKAASVAGTSGDFEGTLRAAIAL